MHYRLSIAGVAAALLLGGCSTIEERQQQRVADIPEAGRGYVVGTFAIQCKPADASCVNEYDAQLLQFRSADKTWEDSVAIGNYGVPTFQRQVFDYERAERAEKGKRFCVPLRPGSYGFYGFTYFIGGIAYSFKRASEFNLAFIVKPGEITDVGKLKLTSEHGRHLLGFQVPVPGMLLLSGQPKADIDAALQKCPERVRAWPVREASLRAMDAATPLVRMNPAP
ncbi:hypothetical protein HH212_23210 [Massilia forsythiae]|uniref:Lipoprotein n=1 Tax=Massilia forsythiae TaxID=2728020 RepID=A0A7Z2W0E0_9BURK|nr:hypothetical protein [Massilia forsythiae]QJE02569.1 hypothetical protein HH212_23210 [Massilia forsythiae]